MNWLGMDIGGANLKLADGKGFAQSMSFALWSDSAHLAQTLRTLIAHAPLCDHLAVTMTGELADCFANKAEGVRFILGAVQDASDRRHTRVYLNNGLFVTPQVAAQRPAECAAANWHALATFAARFVGREPALLIDIGSTTTDVIPILDGRPAARGRTDTERLVYGELVYCGVERTPVCALVRQVPYQRGNCPVARELFATAKDVYLILGDLSEDPLDIRTADGRPATKAAARARLARLLCADLTEFNHRDAVRVATTVAQEQIQLIAQSIAIAVSGMSQPPVYTMLSGCGEFLAERALAAAGLTGPAVNLSRKIGAAPSRCAPAHAIAVLAREACGL